MRLAAFQNPEFYKAQSMRLSVYGKPRVIGCADDTGEYIGLPRGCLDDLLVLFQELGIIVVVEDKRYEGVELNVSFTGELWAKQDLAVAELLKHDFGVLSWKGTTKKEHGTSGLSISLTVLPACRRMRLAGREE